MTFSLGWALVIDSAPEVAHFTRLNASKFDLNLPVLAILRFLQALAPQLKDPFTLWRVPLD